MCIYIYIYALYCDGYVKAEWRCPFPSSHLTRLLCNLVYRWSDQPPLLLHVFSFSGPRVMDIGATAPSVERYVRQHFTRCVNDWTSPLEKRWRCWNSFQFWDSGANRIVVPGDSTVSETPQTLALVGSKCNTCQAPDVSKNWLWWVNKLWLVKGHYCKLNSFRDPRVYVD